MTPIVPDRRLLEIIRGYIADLSTPDTRPDMSDEHHLMALGRVIVDECQARLPLWDLEKGASTQMDEK